eukprot:TRINITY_DN3691_c0_g1_i1.p1 TRINITY_DN3691_c0_g1~~TRINITY_DN3691_c0_g1_i1.p1  ORF type:complete len:109 (+),score=27.67 TRINITY_DN3691_c0_g1_i1:78-404(+)
MYSWVSISINGIINFTIPMLLYIISRRKKPNSERDSFIKLPGESSEEEEDQILQNDYHVTDYHFKVLPKSKFVRPTCIAITSIVIVSILCVVTIVLNLIPHESIISIT